MKENIREEFLVNIRLTKENADRLRRLSAEYSRITGFEMEPAFYLGSILSDIMRFDGGASRQLDREEATLKW